MRGGGGCGEKLGVKVYLRIIPTYQPSVNPRSRFGHSVRRPGQFVCPNSDSVCPNSDKIYLTVVMFRFLLLFFAY